MKTNIIVFAGTSALVVALVIGLTIVRPVLAQVAATSTGSTATSTSPIEAIAPSTPTDASSSPPVENVSTSAAPVQTAPVAPATTTINSSRAGTAETAKPAPIEPPPAGFTEVHIIGTKYIDYFTDGSHYHPGSR